MSRHILLLAGSLREGSFNARLLRACCALFPAHWQCTQAIGLGDLPAYNGDNDGADPPAAVVTLRAQLAHADAVVIITPEYNHSVPGVLKNAIDWASSPPARMPLSGKVVAAVVATAGSVLGRSALDELRRVLLDMGNFVVPTPQVVVYRAGEKVISQPGSDGIARDTLTCPLSRSLLLALFAATEDALAAGAGLLGRAGLDHLQQQPKA